MSVQIIKSVANLGLRLGQKTGQKVLPQYEQALKKMSEDAFKSAAAQVERATKNTGIAVKLKSSRNPFASVKDYISVRFLDKFGRTQNVKIERQGAESIEKFIPRMAKEVETIKKLVKNYGQDASIAQSSKRGEFLAFFEGQQQDASRTLLRNNLPPSATVTMTRDSGIKGLFNGHKKRFTVTVPGAQSGQAGAAQSFTIRKPQHQVNATFVTQAPERIVGSYEAAINPKSQYTYRQVEQAYDQAKPKIDTHLQEVQSKTGLVQKSWADAINKAKPRKFEPAYQDITGKEAEKLANGAYNAYDQVAAHKEQFQKVFDPVRKRAVNSPSAVKFDIDTLQQSVTRQYDSFAEPHRQKYQGQFEGQMNKRLRQYTRAQEGAKQELAKREPLTKGQKLTREIAANKQEYHQIDQQAVHLHQENVQLEAQLQAQDKAWRENQKALKDQRAIAYAKSHKISQPVRRAAQGQIVILKMKQQQLKEQGAQLNAEFQRNKQALVIAQDKLQSISNWLKGVGAHPTVGDIPSVGAHPASSVPRRSGSNVNRANSQRPSVSQQPVQQQVLRQEAPPQQPGPQPEQHAETGWPTYLPASLQKMGDRLMSLLPARC